MKLTGIADEAGDSLSQQIKAHQQLGWDTIEARFVQIGDFDKGSIHEIPEEAFDLVEKELKDAGMGVNGVYHFGGAPAVSWRQFAEEIFAQAGLSVAVTPIPSADYP
ncbi:MAG: sugar nucleotide-binding protein, partial [Verrucomicrobiota bacterium]